MRPSLDRRIFYLLVLAPALLCWLQAFWLLERGLLFHSSQQGTWLLFCIRVCWLCSVLFTLPDIIGLLAFGSPSDENAACVRNFFGKRWSEDATLIACFVCYGKNVAVLERSVAAARKLFERHSVRYEIEIVTELDVRQWFPADPRLCFLQVPSSYRTPNGSLYKARALQYAIGERRLRHGDLERVWVLHLDEESMLTLDGLAGIAEFVHAPENAARIGQGEIRYNAAHYGDHKLITALDSLRTGTDLGRFRLQLRALGAPTFGLHGSFVLVPAAIEETVGVDFGPRGSITEDAYFGLVAADRGVAFGWVKGHLREQSPHTLADLFRQRRRWLVGLACLITDGRISLRRRAVLIAYMLFWRVAWITPLALLTYALAFGVHIIPTVTFILGMAFGACGSVYCVGAYRNLLDAELSRGRKIRLFGCVVLLISIASALEGAAAVFALLFPARGFHVVRKEVAKPLPLGVESGG